MVLSISNQKFYDNISQGVETTEVGVDYRIFLKNVNIDFKFDRDLTTVLQTCLPNLAEFGKAKTFPMPLLLWWCHGHHRNSMAAISTHFIREHFNADTPHLGNGCALKPIIFRE